MERGSLHQSISPLVDAVDDICRYFFQTGKISDQTSLGNERDHECLGDLVRGDLCTGVALVLQDGRAASWPFAHIWELCDGSRLKQVRINTFGEYSLAQAVLAISTSVLSGNKDRCFRGLIVLGLDMGLLHTWLGVLASRRQVNEKVYDSSALMRTPAAMDIIFSQLCRLLTFPFQLDVESEMDEHDSESQPEVPASEQADTASYKCGGFLEVQLSQNPLEFKVRKETGVFNVEETLIVGGADGVSPWSLVFVREDEQRVLDLGRVIDVTATAPNAEEPSFTITFGPRTRTETFFCAEVQSCVDALHRLLWNFALMRTPHLIEHRQALDKRCTEAKRLFVHIGRAWYAASTRGDRGRNMTLPNEIQIAPPSPVKFSIPERYKLDEKSGGEIPIRKDDASVLLSYGLISELQPSLPRRLQTRKMELIFTTDEHGFSLTHFLQRVKAAGQTLVLIEDTKANVFGCFASSGWKLERGYYGTGETFVFKGSPEVQIFPWVPNSNNFFMQAEESGLGVGGGTGGCGLWIDSSFKHGRSQSCETFANPPLASQEDFMCVKLEVWSFTRPKGIRTSYH